MPYLIAAFRSEEEAKKAYEALIQFLDEEVKYYDVFKCLSEGPLDFDTEDAAQRYVEEMKMVADKFGRKDRVKAEIKLNHIPNIDYGIGLVSYSKKDVRLIGRTIRIEDGVTLLPNGGKEVISLLKARSGDILMSPLKWR